jgi:hypothetical protein
MAGRVATMSVVVFSFPDHETADAAAARLVRRLALPASAVSLGTHAVMGDVHDGLPILAAAVDPESVHVAVGVLEGAGGTGVQVRP